MKPQQQMSSPRGCAECIEKSQGRQHLRNGWSYYYYYHMDFKKPIDFGDNEVNDNSLRESNLSGVSGR